jgi:hypothetical protein
LLEFVRNRQTATPAGLADLRTLVMFCAAMRRGVYEQVGPLDERFEIGLFEDEDYSMRVRDAGYRVMLAEDVFVHHFGQASIGKLAATREYGALFHANRRRFEKKWHVVWQPHRHRRNESYEELVDRIREVVDRTLCRDAAVLVVSKGDPDLLELGGRAARHFLEAPEGGYAGHHPESSADVIAQLEARRDQGAEFLLIPNYALWWLDHYDAFRTHLEERYAQVLHEEDACAIFALAKKATAAARAAQKSD